MENHKKALKGIEKYCRENIEDYELRAQLALSRIDKWRAPLSSVDPSFCCEIEDCISEYCNEHDLNPEDFDAEEVLFYC